MATSLKEQLLFIKNFNKSRRILFNELLELNKRLIKLNKLSKNNSEILLFYNQILNDKYTFKNLRDDVNTFILKIKKNKNYSFFNIFFTMCHTNLPYIIHISRQFNITKVFSKMKRH